MVRIKERPNTIQIEYIMSPKKITKNEKENLKFTIRKKPAKPSTREPRQQIKEGIKKTIKKTMVTKSSKKKTNSTQTETSQQLHTFTEPSSKSPCIKTPNKEIPRAIAIEKTEDVLLQGNLLSNKIHSILSAQQGKYLVKWEEIDQSLLLFPEWLPGQVIEDLVPELVIDFIMGQLKPNQICGINKKK